MKKLFLYLSIILVGVIVFLLTFYASRKYFNENSYKVVLETTEELTTREAVDVMDYMSYQNYLIKEEIIAHAAETVTIPKSYIKYNLGIKNGYIVVYNNLSEDVYEYTDIDVDIIRELDYKLYQQIEEMEFETKEELFDFLESIDS